MLTAWVSLAFLNHNQSAKVLHFIVSLLHLKFTVHFCWMGLVQCSITVAIFVASRIPIRGGG